MSEQTEPNTDLLYGLAAVAGYMNVTETQLQYLIRKKKVPSFMVGKKTASTKKLISNWLAEQEAAAKSHQD